MPQREDPGKLTLCAWCGTPVQQRGHKERYYCNAACRSKAWQRRRQQTLEERERSLRRLLEEALGKLAGEG
ncbi:MAG: hypothetical protein O6926_07995 [candidate division NC10 bacterium]|nr:hypothetical protein [candidate division NC10 bacterium]